MYTGGNKAEQIKNLQDEVDYLTAKVEKEASLPPSVDWWEGYYRRHAAKTLQKKKRKLGRLERQLRY
jgi:hypothetical protein